VVLDRKQCRVLAQLLADRRRNPLNSSFVNIQLLLGGRIKTHNFQWFYLTDGRLCGLVVRVLGYRSGGPGSILGITIKTVESGTGSTQPREYN
jgi:hypothetical protein